MSLIARFLYLIKKNVCLVATRLWYTKYKRNNNLWVFGEWFGERCCDNGFYFANYVAETHPKVDLVWIAKEHADVSKLNSRIKKCVMDSPEAVKNLKNAGVIFMVQAYEDIMQTNRCYYGGAMVINLWHGIPWKKIHYDNYKSWNLLYQKMRTKFYGGQLYLATSDEFRKIMHSAFNINDAHIICSGYPRNSIFYNVAHLGLSKQRLLAHLRSIGMSLDYKSKFVTYMPTFRDKTQKVFSFEDIASNKKLNDVLENHNAYIIQKSHFVSNQRHPYSSGKDNRVIYINDYQSQELLAATDMLITDYSSCFFDFLVLDRPIIHYLYDYDYYANDDRGLYYRKEDVVGGDVAKTVDELMAAIDENLRYPEKNKVLRQQRREKYLQYESSDSCEIIYSEVLNRIDAKI